MQLEEFPQMIEQGALPEIIVIQRPGEPHGANTYRLECMGSQFDIPVSLQDLKDHFGYEDREHFEIDEEITAIMCRMLRPLASLLTHQPYDPFSPAHEQLESVLVLYALLKNALTRIEAIKRVTAKNIADRLTTIAAEQILDRHTYEFYFKCRALRDSSLPPRQPDVI
ncbi:hypothetical protein HYZ98_00110 [Candidatus Peregrinibacteria bacterium]|nr:hypothetical protein [Candidatus Peregrinibacteria bacterium]